MITGSVFNMLREVNMDRIHQAQEKKGVNMVKIVGFEVFTAVSVKNAVFWDVASV